MTRKIQPAVYLLAASALVQLLLILYKHFIGYVVIESVVHLVVMWTISTLLSVPVLALLIWFDLLLMRRLEKQSWEKKRWLRALLEGPAILLIGGALGLLITVLFQAFIGYAQPFAEVLRNNLLIATILNILIVTGLEAYNFYHQHQAASMKAQALEKENIHLRFETLKKQLDPHFLFNSLNVLASLITKDSAKAQEFIDEFSSVYRYTLEVIDKQVVTVAEELEFARSYLFLQQIRFGEGVRAEINVDPAVLRHFLPPLAVQILLENAIKHNIAGSACPLQVRIFSTPDALIVVNNVQKKGGDTRGKGLGLANLKARYALLTDEQPKIIHTAAEYKVRLPLIEPD
ncbi:MAG TPA: histidine kinase [bacterium]|nr:histidine kinase [bacterium]HPN36321.1 histidine kinase [bacterium]